VANLTWQNIHELNPDIPSGFTPKKPKLPICNICSINHRLQYKRPPDAEITSDSHEFYYCEYADQYVKSSEYLGDIEIEIEDSIMLGEFRGYFSK
jgi:hypothetical protein